MTKTRVMAAGLFLVAAFAGTGLAADMGVTPPVPMARPAEAGDTAGFARRKAVLLLIRQNFSLLDAADVLQELALDVTRVGSAGPSEDERAALDDALLAEGSYYLVSLRYLVLAGGAAWPSDRASSAYENDALVQLDALQEQLFEAVATRADPLPVFIEAQQIWAQTEGLAEIPEDLDLFGQRDALVEDVLPEDAGAART